MTHDFDDDDEDDDEDDEDDDDEDDDVDEYYYSSFQIQSFVYKSALNTNTDTFIRNKKNKFAIRK